MKRKLVERIDINILKINKIEREVSRINGELYACDSTINNIMYNAIDRFVDAEDLLDDKNVRSNNLSRVEVLDRVKKINMIPSLDMMNTEMVADYLEIDIATIKKNVLIEI